MQTNDLIIQQLFLLNSRAMAAIFMNFLIMFTILYDQNITTIIKFFSDFEYILFPLHVG